MLVSLGFYELLVVGNEEGRACIVLEAFGPLFDPQLIKWYPTYGTELEFSDSLLLRIPLSNFQNWVEREVGGSGRHWGKKKK